MGQSSNFFEALTDSQRTVLEEISGRVAEAERKHVRQGVRSCSSFSQEVAAQTCKRGLDSQIEIGGQARVVREGRLGKPHRGKQNVQFARRESPSTGSRFSRADGSKSRSAGAHGRVVFSEANVGGSGARSWVSWRR